jgi:hypothetical protein
MSLLFILPHMFFMLQIRQNAKLLQTLTYKKTATMNRILVAIVLRINQLPKCLYTIRSRFSSQKS